jgi:hypothetical protein
MCLQIRIVPGLMQILLPKIRRAKKVLWISCNSLSGQFRPKANWQTNIFAYGHVPGGRYGNGSFQNANVLTSRSIWGLKALKMICSIGVPQSRKTIDRSTEPGEGQAQPFEARSAHVVIHAARFREQECNPCRVEKVADICRDMSWVPSSEYAVAFVFR